MGRFASILLSVFLVSAAACAQEDTWALSHVYFGDTLAEDPDSGVAAGQVKFNVVRADASGGEATFEVACGDAVRPGRRPHIHSYDCTWQFDHDVSHLASGQSVLVRVRSQRTDQIECDCADEGAPVFDVMCGGPRVILAREHEDHDLDLDIFPATPTITLRREFRDVRVVGESDGTLEVRVGNADAEEGQRGFFNIALWSSLNCSVHMVYVYDSVPAPVVVLGPSPDDWALARNVLAMSVGLIEPDPALDLDQDGVVDSRDASLVLQGACGHEEHPRPRRHHRRPPPVLVTAVPDVNGLTVCEAKRSILRSRLEVAVVGRPPAGDQEAFFVCVGQNPECGSRVPLGSRVTLRLAVRPELLKEMTVPNVVGMTEAVARATVPCWFTVESSPCVVKAPREDLANTVVEQAPAPGSTGPRGAKVRLTLYGAYEPDALPVPSVVGMKEAVARAAIPHWFNVVLAPDRQKPPSADLSNTVAAQQPAPGEKQVKGANVRLTMYGPFEEATIEVPDLVGLDEQAARAKMPQGLAVEVAPSLQKPPSQDRANTISAQLPAAGTRVGGGARVKLIKYGEFEVATAVVPNVVGMTEQVARAQIPPIFTVEIAPNMEKAPNEGSAHTVVAQAPPAGAKERQGAKVRLTLYGEYEIPTAVVPNVVGMTEVAARAQIPQLFSVQVAPNRAKAPNEKSANTVAGQAPPAGTKERQGAKVTLTLYGDYEAPTGVVPNVVGMTEEAARAQIPQMFPVEVAQNRAKAPNPKSANTVAGQAPPAGTKERQGAKVTLTLYGDYEAPTGVVPNVVGMTEEAARAQIPQMFAVEIAQNRAKAPNERSANTVAGQAPPAGTKERQGAKVTLTLYGDYEAPTGLVPNVVGMTEEAARAQIPQMFAVEIAQKRAKAPNERSANTVAGQAPPAGSRERQGTRVTLTLYGDYEAPTGVVPNVVGMTEEAARAQIPQMFTVEVAQNRAKAPNEKSANTVAGQAPPAGTKERQGAKVTLTLYGDYEAPTGVVPNVVGMTEEAARAQIPQMFPVEVAQNRAKAPNPKSANTVAGQAPPAGSREPVGSKVVLTLFGAYEAPEEAFQVPNVVGMQARDAKAKFPPALVVKFHVAPQDAPDASREFAVASQDPAPGASVKKGAVIILKIYRRLPPKEEKKPEKGVGGTWEGVYIVIDGGSNQHLGKAGARGPLKLQVIVGQKGQIEVDWVGFGKGSGRVDGEKLSAEWKITAETHQIALTLDGDTMKGLLTDTSKDGKPDGRAEVQLTRKQ